MNVNDLPIIKERIYEEGLIEQILEALECEYVKPIGNVRYEAMLPVRFMKSNKRAVQVKNTPSLGSHVYNTGVSGDIFILVGYILYGVESQDELYDFLFQCKAFICNLFGWHEYITHEQGDDFEEIVEKKDYLAFLRPTQKDRKKRKRLKVMRDKENQVLDKNSVFSWYRATPHEHFIEDGISVKTQRLFEVMFDETTMRVVFPIYNSQGELVSIKGRYVGTDEWVLDEIKYLYLYSFDKSIELFNYHRALQYIKESGEVIVFESEKSCMKAYQYGFKNCVAICGSELSPVQAHMLIMLGVFITFAFDNDMDEEHVRKQAKQIRTRKCFWIKDTLGLLGEKDAPVDKGKVTWKKTNKRVPKRLVTIPALAILLATLATTGSSHGHEAKAKNVEPQSVMYYNPLMDKALEDMKKKVEEERKREEVVIAAEAKTVENPLVKPVIKEKKKEAPKSKKVDPDDGDWETYRLTYYGMDCNGCSGVTASGIDVGDATEYDGYKVLSVDPKKIPLGSIVRINDGDSTFEAIAIDTGGAIKGNKLDLLVGSEKESYKYGVKKIKLKVVREGWQGKRK